MFKSIAQMEAYYWVARLGSFHAAADRLGLTQPSISIRIKELEADVGTRLFTRDSRGARLTEQGHIMFDHIERVISLLHDLGGHFGDAGSLQGLLRIGVPDSFAACCMSSFMRLLEERHPDLNVSIRVDNSRSLIQRMEENYLDVAILAQPKISSAYYQELLGQQILIWVASPMLSLPLQNVSPEILARQRIITNPLPSPLHTVLMDWFAYHKLVPSHVNQCNSVGTIASITIDGQGVSIVPECAVQQALSEGTLLSLDVGPPLPKQEMFMVYPKRALNRGMKEIVTVMRDAAIGTGFVEEM